MNSRCLIGSGTYGKVYKSFYANREVAVKVISIRKAENEIKIMKMLNHKNIIRYISAIQTQEKCSIIMELFYGNTLFDYVVEYKNLTEELCKPIFHQMCEGVYYMHGRGIIHRDLKLDNCLINGEKHIKWIDFGLSTTESSQSPKSFFCGSHSYAAPELYMPTTRRSEFASDVWSLTVCLFTMIFGFFPFKESNHTDWRYSHAFKSPHIVKTILSFYDYVERFTISDELNVIIQQGLQHIPKYRITAKDMLQTKWFMNSSNANV